MNVKSGIAALGIGFLLGASFSFSQATEDTQQQIQTHAQKVQAYLQERRPDLAIPELEALVALDPHNADAQGNLGVLLFFANQYAQAIPHLKAAVTAQPALTRIQGLLGIAERNVGNSEAARNDMEIAFPLLHDQKFKVQIGMQLVELYTASGDLEKAAFILGQLQQIDPKNQEVLYAAYRTYSDLTAETMLTLSLVAPDSAQMHQMMAHEEVKQGNTNGAIAQYRQAIAINPNLPGIHFELAELLNTADDPKVKHEALQEYQEALKQDPMDVKTICRFGDIYAQKEDWTQAYNYYAKAVKLEPANAEANFGLAKTLIAMGQKKKALPILQRAVELEPTDASAHYRLSTLYREEGRPEDAKRELAQFLKYKQMKDKLQAIYKETRIQPQEIHANGMNEKH
jgi:tetratricopeptide (TPR) repeat protein